MLYAASNGMIVSSAVSLCRQVVDLLAEALQIEPGYGVPTITKEEDYFVMRAAGSINQTFRVPACWFPAEPREQDLAKPLYPLIETSSGPATLAVETVSALRAALTAAQQRVRTLESEVAMMARMNRSPISAPQAPVEEVTVAK